MLLRRARLASGSYDAKNAGLRGTKSGFTLRGHRLGMENSMSKNQKADSTRALLLRMIDDAYDGKAWHGPNLRGPLRRVSAKQAVWRPRCGRRNMGELVLHCAYWKYAVNRRITGAKRGSFPQKGSNWFDVPSKLTDKEWRGYLAVLDEQHRALRETLVAADMSQLQEAKSSNGEIAPHVYGVAMHDIYHAGQIRSLKALCERVTRAK